MGTAKSASVTLDFDRETKNTRRFVENDAQGQPVEEPVIGTIYVPKATLDKIGGSDAKQIVVTVAL